MAREDRAGDRDDQERDDTQQAIHQDRRHGLHDFDTLFRQAVSTYGVAADARGQKGSDERADEEDSHHRSDGRAPPRRRADLKVGTTYRIARAPSTVVLIVPTFGSARRSDVVPTFRSASRSVAALVGPTFRSASRSVVPTLRSARTIDRRKQRPPSIRHQHAIGRDERARQNDETPIGVPRSLPHSLRIA